MKDEKRFILVAAGLTVIFCVIVAIYNFASMPPYGSGSAVLTSSDVRLYSSSSVSSSQQSSGSSMVSSGSQPSQQSAIVNINTATLEQLEGLKGIGPTLAQRIIDYREQNGGFKTADELLNVKGIGSKKYDDIKNSVTVG